MPLGNIRWGKATLALDAAASNVWDQSVAYRTGAQCPNAHSIVIKAITSNIPSRDVPDALWQTKSE